MSQEYSKACCTIPPVVVKDYEEKGQWIMIDGMKTYVTGPPDAKRAIFWFYDIFGFYPQTIQGADLLASSTSSPFLVIMPDFFEGKPAKLEWYPPVTDDQFAKLGKFIQTTGDLSKVYPMIPKVTEEAQKKYTAIEKWGAVGFCWGGKVVSVASGTNTVFAASAQSSPSMVDPEDAAKVTIPMMILASKDEDIVVMEKFEAALKVKKVVKTNDQVHGYMSARADFDDPNAKTAYEDGYLDLLNFFSEHL